MSIEWVLPVSMLLGLTAWALVFRNYVHPRLGPLPLAEALRPILVLHVFRYLGLMFLVPGVTAAPLDPRFAVPAAFGDLIAALLALLAIALLRRPRALVPAVSFFNIWGLADLINAVGRGLAYTPDGALGAAFWIPVLIVPLLVVSHIYVFLLLWRRSHTLQPAR